MNPSLQKSINLLISSYGTSHWLEKSALNIRKLYSFLYVRDVLTYPYKTPINVLAIDHLNLLAPELFFFNFSTLCI